MYYLNTDRGLGLFQMERKHDYFVDKSMLIEAIDHYASKTSPYIAITKPRRFGKTMAANMLAAYFSKGCDAKKAFGGLAIMKKKSIRAKMNHCNVIHMDCLEEIANSKSYDEFNDYIHRRLTADLQSAFPNLVVTDMDTVSTLLAKTGEQFIFIIDEWDAIFECTFMSDQDKERYMHFLRGLFKNKNYVQWVFLTGILPIAKYSSGSPLNMFHEFNAFGRIGFEAYYGFSEEEIVSLLQTGDAHLPTLEEIRMWYDGYICRTDGKHLLNPNSVRSALLQGKCMNFWSGTGPMNDLSKLIALNAFSIRDDILRMMAGESIAVALSGFSVESGQPSSREDILSAMVVYGFLTYHDGLLSIPNLELSQKFATALQNGALGVTMRMEESRKLLEATIRGNQSEVASCIERIHDAHIPFIQYSDENSLACVIMYAYYAAFDWYDMKREQPSGKGYVDFSFLPIDHVHIPIVMELKYNRSAKAAIEQIRQNNYILSLKEYPEVLFVGINYSTKTKKHTCLIERTSFQKEQERQ